MGLKQLLGDLLWLGLLAAAVSQGATGQIRAENGSFVQINGNSLTGGLLGSTGTGRIHLGVIGAGGQGSGHARTWAGLPESRLMAVCDVNRNAAARAKDSGKRCDIEAGMAKLLAARTAWSNADAALQVHGGNGYALEYEISRILCDARILNIFEGAAEIQAQVIAKGLAGGRN